MSQRFTEEFLSIVNLDLEELKNETLPEWQHHYNWLRAHGSFKGKIPMDIVCERLEKTPLWENVHANYETEMMSINHPKKSNE
jgi:transposase InsO family protein